MKDEDKTKEQLIREHDSDEDERREDKLAELFTSFTDAKGLRRQRVVELEQRERNRVEEELRESKEIYHSLYSSMSEGVCLHEIIYNESGDAVDYKIVDVNPSYELITGLDREIVIGSKASELYGTGKPPYIEIYAKVAALGQPASFETYFPPMDKYFSISVRKPHQRRNVLWFSLTAEGSSQQYLAISPNASRWRSNSAGKAVCWRQLTRCFWRH